METKKKKINYYQKGFLTLISALIVTAIGLSISVSLILLGLGVSRTSFVTEQSYQANALANACAEQALQQIHDSMVMPDPIPDPVPVLIPATGTGNLTLGQGTCSYTISDIGGNARKITAGGTIRSVIRKIQITISAVNPITVSSFQEVADFN
jgi:hypothetical protein